MSRKKPVTGIILAGAAAISFAANTTASPISVAGGGTVLTYLVIQRLLISLTWLDAAPNQFS